MDAKRPVALVTGAAGFLGGELARALLARGYEVRALVRDRSQQKAVSLERDGCEVMEGDICDRELVLRAGEGCTHIFHIAAAFRTAKQPDSYYQRVNADAVRHVVESTTANGVERLVHCSTCGVHGNVQEIPANEETPFNPGDVYQRTKLDGELIAQEAMREGVPVSIVRPTGFYGHGDMRFLKLFRPIQSGAFRMFGSGEIFFHMTYIDDMVEGHILAGEHPNAVGEVFLIAGDEYVSLNDLVALIAKELGVRPPTGRLPVTPLVAAAFACEMACRPLGIEPPLHRRRVHFFTKARAFSNEKAKRLLGFQPKVSLEEGIHRMAQWYRDQGHLPAQRQAA